MNRGSTNGIIKTPTVVRIEPQVIVALEIIYCIILDLSTECAEYYDFIKIKS